MIRVPLLVVILLPAVVVYLLMLSSRGCKVRRPGGPLFRMPTFLTFAIAMLAAINIFIFRSASRDANPAEARSRWAYSTSTPSTANQSSSKNALTLEEAWKRLNKPKIRLVNTASEKPKIELVDTPLQALDSAEKHADRQAKQPSAEHESNNSNADASPSDAGASPPEASTFGSVDREEAHTTDSELAPEPPVWVVHPPKRVGNTQRRVLVSDPFTTVDECHEELSDRLRQAMLLKLAEIDGMSTADWQGDPPPIESMGIGLSYIRRQICRDEYVESVDASVGPMKKVYLLLEFDPSIEQHLREVWNNFKLRERINNVVFIASLGLMLLAAIYGLLKFDTWSRGYYTKRLLLGVPVVIIGLLVLWVTY